MKPIKLTIENLNSFREPQTVDFAALAGGGNMFCVSGDTGSGKSTIFSAMMIALYGGAPKKGTNLADYVNLSADKACVTFEFEADGDIYETKRTIKRVASGNNFTLKKNGETEAFGEKEVTAKINEIIGLEQDQFTQVALLEQGEFDKFLDSGHADRSRMLRKLLNLERFGDLFSIANGMNDEVKRDIGDIEKVLNRFESEGRTEYKLRECKAAVKTLDAEVKEYKKESEELNEKIKAEENSRKRHENIVRLRAELEKKSAEKVKYDRSISELTAKSADPDREKDECVRREEQLQNVQKSAEKLIKDRAEVSKKLDESRKEWIKTKAACDDLDKELKDSLKGDMDGAVALILSHTEIGDKCPVCGGVISAHTGESGSVSDRAEKEKRFAALNERLANIEKDGVRLAEEMKKIEAQIKTEITPHGDIPEGLRIARNKAAELTKLIADRKAAENGLAEVNSVCATLQAELEKQGDDDYDEARGNAVNARVKECAALLEEKIKAQTENRKEIELIEKALAEASELKKELKTLNARQKELAIMVDLFRGNKFSEYVTEEYIKDFTVSASAILSRLSGGNYTLGYRDKEFRIKDFLNGNKERKVKTLSGGETFLASMSLAISIMQYVSAGKNIDFFFLDEGFGTLHEEAVETVVAALRELAKDVMVGVISHVDVLVDRIQSRITVKHATDECGSVIMYD